MTKPEPFDFSKLHSLEGDDGWWFHTHLRYEISKLERLLGAIQKWRQVADTEFDEFQKLCDQKRPPGWDQYGYDHDQAQDEAFMLLETERVMFANLAVTIASAAENFVIGICKGRNLPCEKNGKTDLCVALNSLSKAIGRTISELPGYGGNQRARLLGNCFKHTEGKANQRFVDKYGGSVGETIEYEKEAWEQMIGETETLLSEIVSRLKTEPKT